MRRSPSPDGFAWRFVETRELFHRYRYARIYPLSPASQPLPLRSLVCIVPPVLASISVPPVSPPLCQFALRWIQRGAFSSHE